MRTLFHTRKSYTFTLMSSTQADLRKKCHQDTTSPSLSCLRCIRTHETLLFAVRLTNMGLMDELKPGVLVGEDVIKLLDHAKKEGYAIPAFNCTSSSTINACMEAAAKTKSPIMIQVSNGGGVFYAGKFLDNTNQRACIAGSLAAAHHVHQLAELYGMQSAPRFCGGTRPHRLASNVPNFCAGIPVVLHTDHCAKKLLPWFDGMMDVNEQYFKAHGKPLFSSHMLDLSEEPLEEILEYCEKYLTRMAKMGITLELEIGITGGEEDGVDNSGIDKVCLIWRRRAVVARRVHSERAVLCLLHAGEALHSPRRRVASVQAFEPHQPPLHCRCLLR